MENHHKNYLNYENYEEPNFPSIGYNKYYNDQLKRSNEFDFYPNNNNINLKSHNLNYANPNEKEFNNDFIDNQKSNYIKNKNDKKFFKTNNNFYLLDEDEKILREKERQKKLQYQLMLDDQIREKKIRKEKERQERLAEELLYEEKYRQKQRELIQYQKEREREKNDISLKESIEIPLSNKNYLYDINQNYLKNVNYEENLEQKDNYEQQNNQKIMMNLNQNKNINNNYLNSSINQKITPPTIENLISTSAQMPFLNKNEICPQNYKTQNNYYPNYKINITQQQSPKYFISQIINPYMTQNNEFQPEIPLNASASPGFIPVNYQAPINNQMLISSPNISNSSQVNQFQLENISNFNRINNQNINDINNMDNNNQNYFEKMMEIFFNEQNKIIENYKETIMQLKNERDEALIKNKINEEKLKALENMRKCRNKINDKFDYIPLKDEYNQDLDNYLSTIQKDELNINNPKGEMSILSDSKLPPLLTSSKLIKPNSKGNFLETWKKQGNENGKKLEFNGMDTNYIMNKISQIKNNILENSSITNNEKKNDCMIDISLISKTNEDKSKNNENNEFLVETNGDKSKNNENDFEFQIETNEDINNSKKEVEDNNDSVVKKNKI